MSLKRRLQLVEDDGDFGLKIFTNLSVDDQIPIYMVKAREHEQLDLLAITATNNPDDRNTTQEPKTVEALRISGPLGKCYDPLKNPEHNTYSKTPPFLVSVLTLPGLSGITRLYLDRCLSIEDWNLIGLKVLEPFKSLVDLSVVIPYGRKNVMPPLCHTELVGADDNASIDDQEENLKWQMLQHIEFLFCRKRDDMLVETEDLIKFKYESLLKCSPNWTVKTSFRYSVFF